MTRRSNYDLNLRHGKLRTDKITAETTKRLLTKNLPTLRNNSSFVVQLNIHNFEDKGNFAVYFKGLSKFFSSTQGPLGLMPGM